MQAKPAQVFCLMGPTAAGKTSLAFALTERFPFELISVDSAMIYRSMDIGTAKPTLEELKRYPHHLIDIKDPNQTYSAAEFCKDAARLSDDILSRGKIPLLVGGTMMYFHALQQGLSSLPEADEGLRASILEKAEKEGWGHMHQLLSQVDFASGLRIHPNDSQRIQRALEVYYMTGKALSLFLEDETKKLPYDFINLILFPKDRAWLHARIALRFENMLNQGFLEEVENLMQNWSLHAASPAMRAVGYRQAHEYLSETTAVSYQEFCNKGLAATRQLAKRQLTWLRSWSDGQRFDCEKTDILLEGISAFIKQKLYY